MNDRFYGRSSLCKFELVNQESMKIPIWIIIGFQQKYRQDSQNLNNHTFFRLPVTSAQYIIETEKYPDSGILLIYDDNYFSRGYGCIKEAFRALSENNNLQQYL